MINSKTTLALERGLLSGVLVLLMMSGGVQAIDPKPERDASARVVTPAGSSVPVAGDSDRLSYGSEWDLGAAQLAAVGTLLFTVAALVRRYS